ncbi:ATP-binding protein [Streptomyces sp. SID2999]|uniref:ATP-binding protein n=1 Tax=Streptomyces sp. SID2999 TaxID=2690258 RepID=UPI0013709DD8|nr:ATP-binding protein [Streptomyces sp. SID2999]MYZ10563.1 ATP-binding protein [Streptomyces sp. SID2999]
MSPTPAQEAVTVRTFAQRFSATRRGARLARRLATHQLDQWGHPYGTPTSDTVALIVAELAANAVLHGRVPGRDFELRLHQNPDRIRVEVSDTHPAHPKLPPQDPTAEGGRGLLLIEAVATRWGTSPRTGPGKTVWAECATHAVPPVCR